MRGNAEHTPAQPRDLVGREGLDDARGAEGRVQEDLDFFDDGAEGGPHEEGPGVDVGGVGHGVWGLEGVRVADVEG